MSANQYIRDAMLSHALELEKLGRGYARSAVEHLNALDADLVAKIAAKMATANLTSFDPTPAGIKRLNDLLVEVRAVNETVYKRVADGLKADLSALGEYEAEFAVDMLKGGIGAKVGFNLPPATYIRQLVENSPIDGHLLDSWTKHMGDARSSRVEQAIRLAQLGGEGIDGAVNRIRGTRQANYSDGILEVSRRSAQSLAITANSTIANNTRNEVYKRNPRWIRGLLWVSTLDTRTTPICQSRDGHFYRLDEEHPTPPAHIRCRSIFIPVTKSFEELDAPERKEVTGRKRASMDGQVPANTTFGDWLNAQSTDRQEAILGKERAQLYRDGKVAFKDLFNDAGEYRSVKELKAGDLRTKPPAPAPTPTPAPAPKPQPAPKPKAPEAPVFIQPRNSEVTAATVKVEARSAVVKRLTASLMEAAKDSRYSIPREFKGRSPSDWGKAAMGGFTDEAASVVGAIMPELDALADAFKIPRLRGVKAITSKTANMDMGDGVIGINANMVNPLAATIGGGEGTAALVQKAVDMADELKGLLAQINHYGAKIQDHIASGKGMTHEYVDLIEARNALAKAYNTKAKAVAVAKRQAQASTLTASDWTPGDAVAAKPWSVKEYYANGVDRIRSTMYHEFAHHVHQMTGKTGNRNLPGNLPPLEKTTLPALFKSLGRDGLARLASKYGETDPKGLEFFAEQFALYMMGQQAKMEKGAIVLIEELMTNAKKS